MKKIAVIQSSILQSLASRIMLALRVDTTIRALRTTSIPSIVPLTVDGVTGFGNRSVSQYFTAVYAQLRNGKPDSAFPILSGQSIKDVLDEAQANNIQISALLDELNKIKTEDGKDSQKTVIDKKIEEIWSKSGIISFMANVYGMKDAFDDKENAVSLNRAWSNWRPDYGPTAFMSDFSESFFISGQPGEGSREEAGADDFFRSQHWHVVYDKRVSQLGQVDVTDLIKMPNLGSGSADVSMQYVNKLYTMLTDYELLNQLDGFKNFADEHVRIATTTAAPSDNKTISILITEAKRIQALSECRVFVMMQGWIALIQLLLKGVYRGEVVEHVKNVFPALDSTYDIDALIKQFFDLKVGVHTAAFMSSIDDIDTLEYNRERVTALHVTKKHGDVIDELGYAMSIIQAVVPFLKSLLTSKSIWDMYDAGATYFKTEKVARKSRMIKSEDMPVSFTQMGVLVGDPIASLEDLQMSAIMDWGINKFNSSARTLIQWGPQPEGSLVHTYSYGVIDYVKLSDKRDKQLASLRMATTMPLGPDIASLNMPMVPFRRVVANDTYYKLLIDKFLIELSPVSLLPVEPIGMHPLTTNFSPVTIKKDVVGKYDTSIDSLPLTMLHCDGKRATVTESGDVLCQMLGISKTVLEPGFISRSPMLNKFFIEASKSLLCCAAIVRDKLFADMINCFYYVPTSFLDHRVRLLYVTNDFRQGESGEVSALVETSTINIHLHKVMVSKSVNILQAVPGRISGSPVYFENNVPRAKNTDDISLNVSA